MYSQVAEFSLAEHQLPFDIIILHTAIFMLVFKVCF